MMCSYTHEIMPLFNKFKTDSSNKHMNQMKCKRKEEETRMEENDFN